MKNELKIQILLYAIEISLIIFMIYIASSYERFIKFGIYAFLLGFISWFLMIIIVKRTSDLIFGKIDLGE